MSLRSHTVLLDEQPDLLAIAGADGMLAPGPVAGTGLAARGCALELPVDTSAPDGAAALADALEAIDADDHVRRPGTGPVAVGALPFRPGAPALMVVPELVVGWDGQQGWLTVTGSDLDAPGADEVASILAECRARAGAAQTLPPDGFTLTSMVPHDKWCAVVEDAVADIGQRTLSKVVLAREVLVEANRTIPVGTVLERLQALYPSCHLFSVDGFVGASPELLVSRIGGVVRSHPLAGTLAHSGDARVDEEAAAGLLGSVKDRWEHGLVVEAVAEALRPHCDELDVPEAPSIVSLRNVMHLGTEITGRASDDASALTLALALHPTPAVGGTPTDAAIAWIDAREGIDRGRYAGPVGWVDQRGDGVFVVGIRSAEIAGRTARLFAGVGVVAGSDPQDELAETQLKLQALLAALVRP